MPCPAAIVLWAMLLGTTGCTGMAQEPGGLPVPPGAFREAGPAAQALDDVPPRGTWWRAFGDPALDDLIERANRGSFTVRQAAGRLQQAQALHGTAQAAQRPLIAFNANAARADGGLTNAANGSSGSFYFGGLNLLYEIDLFGRLARASKAAAAEVREQEGLLQAAQLLIQSDIAQTYFTLRALDAERALLRDGAAAQARAVALTDGLFRSGLAAELTLVRLQTFADSIRAEAVGLDQRRAELEHALAVLVGEPASSFQLAPGDQVARLPSIPPGIPGMVLARRPDVGAARAAMFAAQVRVGVAHDSWLPTISLSGLSGLASPSVANLVGGSASSSSAGALLSVPLLDGGRHRAVVAKADADLEVAAASYGSQVLVAIKEVEDQLSALRLLAEREAVVSRGAAAAQRTSQLVASNQKDGLASQLEVIDAEAKALTDRRQELQVRAARLVATVGLVRALGGGWDRPVLMGAR